MHFQKNTNTAISISSHCLKAARGKGNTKTKKSSTKAPMSLRITIDGIVQFFSIQRPGCFFERAFSQTELEK